MLRGVLIRLWAQSRMLDVVQKSFESGGVERAEVLRVAAISTLLTASNDMYNFFSNHNNMVLQASLLLFLHSIVPAENL